MDKKKLKYDLILGCICLLLSLSVWLLVTVLKKPGEYAVITVNGEEYGKYPLSVDTEISVETERGKNVVVIKDGYADIIEATCPDGLCEKQRKIDATGESLVCLPNKVTVTVVGGESEIDLVG